MNPNDIVQLREQAQQWRQRWQADPSREQAAAYLRWLRRSPQHVRAMLEAELFMRRLSRLKLRDQRSAPSNVVRLPMAASLPRPASRPPARSWRASVMAAACGLLAVSTIVLLAVGAAPLRTLSTGPGEWLQQRLIEGSSVKLGPNTALQLRLAEDRREVKLLRGEAYFDVARDARRPFVVLTPVGEVRVLGTSFGMQMREGTVLVAVRKGRVAVQPLRPGNAAAQSPATELRANDRARLTQAGLARLAPLPADEVLAWAEQRFVARNLSFAQIVEELNRRHHQQIVIHDQDLARTHVAYLEVALDRPEALVELMRRWQSQAAVELTEPVAVSP